jgi:RNA polymerase sigma factor (sigma-70 family)
VNPVAAKVALEDVYKEHWASLVRLGLLLTGSRETAEDLVQDAFVRFNTLSFVPKLPGSYLRQMGVNAVHDYRRRQRVERTHVPSGPVPVDIPEVDETWTAIQRLPSRQRDALVLRFYLQLPFDELSQVLGCPLGTAKTLVRRALARLRRDLER